MNSNEKVLTLEERKLWVQMGNDAHAKATAAASAPQEKRAGMGFRSVVAKVSGSDPAKRETAGTVRSPSPRVTSPRQLDPRTAMKKKDTGLSLSCSPPEDGTSPLMREGSARSPRAALLTRTVSNVSHDVQRVLSPTRAASARVTSPRAQPPPPPPPPPSPPPVSAKLARAIAGPKGNSAHRPTPTARPTSALTTVQQPTTTVNTASLVVSRTSQSTTMQRSLEEGNVPSQPSSSTSPQELSRPPRAQHRATLPPQQPPPPAPTTPPTTTTVAVSPSSVPAVPIKSNLRIVLHPHGSDLSAMRLHQYRQHQQQQQHSQHPPGEPYAHARSPRAVVGGSSKAPHDGDDEHLPEDAILLPRSKQQHQQQQQYQVSHQHEQQQPHRTAPAGQYCHVPVMSMTAGSLTPTVCHSLLSRPWGVTLRRSFCVGARAITTLLRPKEAPRRPPLSAGPLDEEEKSLLHRVPNSVTVRPLAATAADVGNRACRSRRIVER